MRFSPLVLVAAASALVAPATVRADFIVTGSIKGNVCSGFIIESCAFHPIAAVKGEDGRLHALPTRFNAVSDFNGDATKGLCWIQTKSIGRGLISWGANAAFQPEFYSLNTSGKYEKLDVEYLVFSCVER